MKRILILLLISLTILTLIGCNSDEKAPEGMQLVSGSESDGYRFYAPEEWIVANHEDYSAAYVSTVNNTSVVFAETAKPTSSVPEYFAAELAKFPFEVTASELKGCNFGNADSAYSCVYDYNYQGRKMRAMQIFAIYGDRFYIFTYNSYNEARFGEADDETYYDYYMPKAQTCIDNILFSQKGEKAESETVVYEKDSDGYNIVSDKTLAGFTLAVPDSYRVDYSSGIVSVTREDGANINVSKATYTGVTRDEYWRMRVENLNSIVDKKRDASTGEILTETVKNEEGEDVVRPMSTLNVLREHEIINLKGCDWACAYEYTYSFAGKEYRVYQVLIVDGYDGFVFTYSAPVEIFEPRLDEALSILRKMAF